MFVIPDFSYFAIPGFIENMKKYPNRSSSLILHNQKDDRWNSLLRQEDPELIGWLHLKSDEEHNIFLPHSPQSDSDFMRTYFDDFKAIIEPAITRIQTFLIELGIEDVESYMEDSKDWVSLLFDFQANHLSAEKAAELSNLSTENFPKILIWTNINQNKLILLHPHREDSDLKEYIKSLYWCIITGTKQSKKKRLNLVDLQKNIEKKFQESHYLKNKKTPVNSLEIVHCDNSIADTLKNIGQAYKNEFDAAILNFEEHVKLNIETSNKKIIDLCNKSKDEVIKILKEHNFSQSRSRGKHEIWQHPNLKKFTTVPRSKLTPFVLSSIQKDLEEAIND